MSDIPEKDRLPGQDCSCQAELCCENLPEQTNNQDRRNRSDRRSTIDRREGWDRRRGPGRRRNDDRRAAEEGEMTDEQFEFLQAVDSYKRANNRPFPSFTELLEIVKALGYRKVAEPEPLKAAKKDG